MDSLNNISTAVTRAIWGTDETTTQEPISGKTGDVSKGQPYDAGNLEPSEQFLAQTPQPTTTEPKFESKPDTIPQTSSSPGDHTTSSVPPDNHSPAIPTVPNPTPSSVPPDNHSPVTIPAPHKNLPSSSPRGDHTTSQSDTRRPSDSHHPERNVDDTNPDALLSGPGPRPLSVVAREHGGDAGRRTPLPPPNQEDVGGAPLERHDSGHQSDKGGKNIRSSGLVADGGDFDASKPGAGREADRLLEEKGLHREGGAAHGGFVPTRDKGSDAVDRLNASGMAGRGAAEKEKVSLKTKIKNKLHRGSHSGEAGTA